MGQSTSRPLNSKVYSAPEVQVDPSLRNELEAATETDTVRRLYTEKYIAEQVAQRLYEEQTAAEKAIQEQRSLIPELGEGRLGASDSNAMRQKVAELHRELTSRPLRGSLDEEGKIAREILVRCLTENKEKPLACRRTFLEFQREVSRIEQRIASSQ